MEDLARKYIVEYYGKLHHNFNVPNLFQMGPFTETELQTVVNNFTKREDIYAFEVKYINPMQTLLNNVSK